MAGLLGERLVQDQLDALVSAQGEDGGWQVTWPAWTPAAGLEWRAWETVRALRVLRAHGRWPE